MSDREPQHDAVLDLLAERLVVGKRTVAHTVRVSTTVQSAEQVVALPWRREDIEIERIPMNHDVSVRPDIRHEGDVIVIPIVEEVPVTSIRLVLREEVRIRRTQRQGSNEGTVSLRREDVRIERFPATTTTQPGA